MRYLIQQNETTFPMLDVLLWTKSDHYRPAHQGSQETVAVVPSASYLANRSSFFTWEDEHLTSRSSLEVVHDLLVTFKAYAVDSCYELLFPHNDTELASQLFDSSSPSRPPT